MKFQKLSLAVIHCIAVNKETGEEKTIPKLNLVVSSRQDFAKLYIQAKVVKMRELSNRTEKWTVQGRCTCSETANMIVSKKPNQNMFIMRDIRMGQHSSNCSLFKPIIHTNKQGRRVGLTKSMFELPKLKKVVISNNNQVTTNKRVIVDDSIRETTNGMLATTFDIGCHLANERFSKYKWKSFEKTLFKQIMDLPSSNQTLRDLKKEGTVSGKKINIDIKKLNTLKIYSFDGSEVFELDEKLESKLTRCRGSLFKILGVDGYIRGDILLSAIAGLKIFNHYLTGSYIVVTIKIKNYGYSKTPILYFQPVHIDNKYILPVESNLERQCMSVLPYFDITNIYKPTSRQKSVFISQLENFMGVQDNALKEYLQVLEEYEKQNNKFVRPDLFVIINSQVIVFEIAGFMNDMQYVKHLEKKEKAFYSKLQHIKYHRVLSAHEMREVLEVYDV